MIQIIYKQAAEYENACKKLKAISLDIKLSHPKGQLTVYRLQLGAIETQLALHHFAALGAFFGTMEQWQHRLQELKNQRAEVTGKIRELLKNPLCQ